MFRRPKPAIAEALPEPVALPDAPSPDVTSPVPGDSPAPFDARWYDPQVAPAEAYAGYLAQGSIDGRAPCPLFSPAWYRARYPDVALAGLEPLRHWLDHGWREGRDPCGLASTAALVSAHPGSGEVAADPLSHWLGQGCRSGIRPHPAIPCFDAAAPDLGLVMVYQGDRHALDLALWSLARLGDGIPMTVYLVDAGDEPDCANLDAVAGRMQQAGLRLTRHAHRQGRSFGALANAGIWAAGEVGRHTHIGLIEQACVIPPGLLRGLVDLWVPMAAPVLNIAAGSQCVPTDFDIYRSPAPLEAVAAFAGRRRVLLTGAIGFAADVEPSCLLFQVGALAAAGMLCEQAVSPREALVPVLAGLARAGLGEPAVGRHLYAHRLDHSPVVRGGAFPGAALAPMPAGLPPGFAPTPDWVLGLAASAAADRAALRGWNAAAPDLIEAHAVRTAAAAAALRRETDRLRERLLRSEGPVPARASCLSRGLCPWDEIAFGDAPRAPATADPVCYRATYRSVQQRMWKALIAADCIDFPAFIGVQPLVAVLAAVFTIGRPILVLTMDTDPVTGDEKDGYVQRVVAIDKALAGQDRLYLKIVEARRNRPALVFLEDGLWRLEIANKDRLGDAVLETVLALGACVYSQSLVGIDPPVVRRLLPERTGPFIMDMHGAVPEEFVLYQNHHMAQKYEKYEAWATAEADLVVCVTDAMAAHFRQKRSIEPARLTVCPIFMHAQEAGDLVRPYNLRPRAVYAGGTQRWQMIPELAALVASTLDRCDWVLLTPDTDGMARALIRAGVPAGAQGLSIRSASQAQVFETYLRCDFGLLLREDCVVNRVACPTKLIEYLRFGVVPVLSTAAVGDFAEMGMRHLSADAFRDGLLPEPAERAAIAAENRAVFGRLVVRSAAGRARLASIACNGLAMPEHPAETGKLRSFG